jgi:hypothetical protein
MRLWWAPPALGALCAGVARETHAAGRSSSPLESATKKSPEGAAEYAKSSGKDTSIGGVPCARAGAM